MWTLAGEMRWREREREGDERGGREDWAGTCGRAFPDSPPSQSLFSALKSDYPLTSTASSTIPLPSSPNSPSFPFFPPLTPPPSHLTGFFCTDLFGLRAKCCFWRIFGMYGNSRPWEQISELSVFFRLGGFLFPGSCTYIGLLGSPTI